MRRLLSTLLRSRRGATAVEYGLIVSLVVIVTVAAVKLVANQTSSMWGNVSSAVTENR